MYSSFRQFYASWIAADQNFPTTLAQWTLTRVFEHGRLGCCTLFSFVGMTFRDGTFLASSFVSIPRSSWISFKSLKEFSWVLVSPEIDREYTSAGYKIHHCLIDKSTWLFYWLSSLGRPDDSALTDRTSIPYHDLEIWYFLSEGRSSMHGSSLHGDRCRR
jgi:hypothetical protein